MSSSSSSDALHQLGFNFIVKTARIAFEAVFYGVYLLLISASTTILCRRDLRSPWRVFLLAVTLVMFAGSTLFFALDVADIIERFNIILVNNPDAGTIQDRVNLADDKLKRFVWTGEILFVFMLILGDSVVLWRTWALYHGERLIILVPFLTWIGSTIAAFFELGCDIKTGWALLDTTPSASSQGSQICARSDLSSFTLSYATNVFCTALIFHKAWRHRQAMKRFLGSARRRTQAEKIMTLLVESGLLYLAIYTLQAVPIYGGSSPGSLVAWEVVNAIIQQAFGMYPTAIVVLVELQKSLWDTDEISRELSDLRFDANSRVAGTESDMSDTVAATTSGGTGRRVELAPKNDSDVSSSEKGQR
ncbi:hypothetical protein AX17_001602 [Amanita inopinata Kibby_2008]|nr:hypothetical protein AX17_001602 [Amanita inopinata Kibby_2008]